MICSQCGHNMFDDFTFCHHCGKPAGAGAGLPASGAVMSSRETPSLPEAAADSREAALSARKIFWVELLCYIPFFNLILLAFMASGRHTPLREFARGKLLALMTLILLLLLTVLTVVYLMHTGVIEPIYLGRWRT